MQAFLRCTVPALLGWQLRLSRLVVEPLKGIMLRLIDFGVPAAVVVITLRLSDDEDSEDFDNDANNPSSCARYSRKERSGALLTRPLANFRIERLFGSAQLVCVHAGRGYGLGPMLPLSDVQLQRRFRDDWAAGVLRRWPAWRQQRRRGG